MRRIVRGGGAPGLIAYAGKDPVGWVSVGPREDFPVLDRSQTLKRVDERPVWSVTCFYIPRGFRRQGLQRKLLEAAVAHARKKGARWVEGYPIEPKALSGCDGYTGLVPVFRKAGFRVAARRTPRQPVMRKGLRPSEG